MEYGLVLGSQNLFLTIYKLSEIRSLKPNKLYHYYAPTLKTANLILKLCDYSIDKASVVNKVYPFWIDMSGMYELYVYSIFHNIYGDCIKFQFDGYRRTRVDFLKVAENEKLIIDAKYKPRYYDSNSGMLDDISEISRYARDLKIVKALGIPEDTVPACLIICPNKNDKTSENSNEKECPSYDDKTLNSKKTLLECCQKIRGFTKFYKLCIELPFRTESKEQLKK